MIKFALLLPIFMILIGGVLEIGTYYIQQYTADRALTQISVPIKRSAGDDRLLREIAYDSGSDFMNLDPTPDSYICALPFRTRAEAEVADCVVGNWDTSPPVGIARGSYFIKVKVFAEKRFTFAFADFMPDIVATSIISVNPGMIIAYYPRGSQNLLNGQVACPYGWEEYVPARGRKIIGLGNSGTQGSVYHLKGGVGGEPTHTMTENELAAHGHEFTEPLLQTKVGGSMHIRYCTDSEGRSYICETDAGRGDVEYGAGGPAGDIQTMDEGGSQPFNITDPVIAVKWCAKSFPQTE